MTPDEAKSLRKGDHVLVRMVVNSVDVDDPNRPIEIGDDYWPLVEDIISVEPRPLEVGDRVVYEDGYTTGELRAVEGDFAWVKCDDGGGYSSKPLSNLTRADPQPSDKGRGA